MITKFRLLHFVFYTTNAWNEQPKYVVADYTPNVVGV